MFTCLAIDDDFSALEILTDYIAEHPKLKLLKTYSNPLVALTEITKRSTPVDIVFLGIEMPEMDGITLAKLIRHKAKKIVFVSAHSNYAINAFELGIDDFLLIPFSIDRLNTIINKLFNKTEPKFNEKEYILVKSAEQRNRFIKIDLETIIVIEAQIRGTKIYTSQQTILSNSAFNEILKLINEHNIFIQVHRAFSVAKKQIKQFDRNCITLKNDKKIPFGRKFLAVYQSLLKDKKLN